MKNSTIKILFLFTVIFCNNVCSQSLKNDTPENFGRLVFDIVKHEDVNQILKYSVFEKENMEKYLYNWLTDPHLGGENKSGDYVKKAMESLPIRQRAFIAKFERFVQDGRVKGVDWSKAVFVSLVDSNNSTLKNNTDQIKYYRDFDLYVQFKDLKTNKLFKFKIDDINNTKNGMIILDGLYWE